MRSLFYPILTILLLQTGLAMAATMERMNRLDRSDLTQIFVTFDKVPDYSHNLSGKRIDLLLAGTVEGSDFKLLPNDDVIAKSLLDHHEGTTILSIFLRYPPQKVNLTTAGEHQLLLEIAAGNEYSETYRDFSRKFGGFAVVRDERLDYTNPLRTSPYAGDWPSFYERYEPEVHITPPILYTLPAFPILGQFATVEEDGESALDKDLTEMGRLGDWATLQTELLARSATETDPEKKKQLALSYGEALLRAGNFIGAYKQFYLLKDTYPDELVGFWSNYLLIYAKAVNDDPFQAYIEAEAFARIVPATSSLSAFLHLLQIETSLATGDMTKLQELLIDEDVAIPDQLYKLVEMRQADYLAAMKKYVPAHVTYTTVAPELIASHPHSLAGKCDALFFLKKFADAADCYETLQPLVQDTEQSALIAFRHAHAQLKGSRQEEDLTKIFGAVEDTYPGTRGSFLAAMKKNDHRYMLDKGWAEQAVKYYKALADNSSWKDVSEECYFKLALTYYLQGKAEEAIPVLMKIRREFRTGNLQRETDALLLSALPQEIQRLIANGQHIEALVLAKQNRAYFERGWIKSEIFPDIAEAYQKSNLNKDAERSYLYLYDIAEDEKKEEYFLPLIQAIFDQKKFSMVDDYGAQYAYLYPEGRYTAEILYLRLQALAMLGKYDKAMSLLPEPLPESSMMRRFAASIAFNNNDFTKCLTILSDLERALLTDQELLMLAESAFQSTAYPLARELFANLLEKDYHGEQAMYRLAEIARAEGDGKTSRDYFTRLVETGKDSLWVKYAERELRYLDITRSIDKAIEGS